MINDIYGFSTTSWISSYTDITSQDSLAKSFNDLNHLDLYMISSETDPISFIKQFKLSDWQLKTLEEKIKKNKKEKEKKNEASDKNSGWIELIETSGTPICIVSLPENKQISTNYSSSMISINKSGFCLAKDLGGSFIKKISFLSNLESIMIDFNSCDKSLASGFLVGMELGSYKFKDYFNKYLKKSKTSPRPSLYFKNIEDSTVKKASILSSGINLTRHLENLPSNIIDPESFKNICTDLFKDTNIELSIYNKDKLKELGSNLILAVASGSKKPCYMIRLRYRSTRSDSKYISLVGKGITFDSGGLDIKTAAGMLLMKKDMSGAASLLSTCYVISQLKPDINCDFYLMLAENSVSDSSYRPGDVILTRNDVSVEIHNTDAEGRLLLADGIAQAVCDSKDKASLTIIDIATLTGANRMALGPSIMGMYTTEEELSSSFKQASYKIGDPLWHMPMYEDYKKNLDSKYADIKNATQENGGGAISASLFLKHFTQGVKHVHLDMYAYTDKPTPTIQEAGSNGQGVALLVEFLSGFSSL